MKIATEVIFKQGLVKTFICSEETRVVDFAERVCRYGKIRLIRGLRTISPRDADQLISQGAIQIREGA